MCQQQAALCTLKAAGESPRQQHRVLALLLGGAHSRSKEVLKAGSSATPPGARAAQQQLLTWKFSLAAGPIRRAGDVCYHLSCGAGG